jgi:uncharacterized DUF497 family protein
VIRFEWDENKARSNRRKHGVGFEDARLVFDDPYALAARDRIQDGELRWQTIGLVGGVALLPVAHTVREESGGKVIRIVSARRASKEERNRYAENLA